MSLLTSLLAPGNGTSDPLGWGFPVSVDPVLATAVQAWPAANRALYFRTIGGGTITGIGLYVGTSSGNIAVGVFSPSGDGRSAVPAARKATSGSVACPATGYSSVSLGGSVTVEPGDFLALVCDNTTASFLAFWNNAVASDIYAGRSYQQNTAMPLPATAGSLTAVNSRVYLLVGVA